MATIISPFSSDFFIIDEMNLKRRKEKFNIGKRLTVILVHPEKPENIGLVARSMKNTGFENLRIVGTGSLSQKSYLTAVHAREILENAEFYDRLDEAIADLHLVFAATSKKRKNFVLLTLEESVTKMFQFPHSTKIGLLFGCERTGLTSEELKGVNFIFSISQASKQPSYNLSSAVLLTLFQIFNYLQKGEAIVREQPISREEQEECIRLILRKLEEKKFIHKGNKSHVTEMIHDLFGRLGLSSRDRRLLLALFSKGVDKRE